jgi:ketosteroid isomerase-like protein
MSQQHEAIARRLIDEGWNRGNLAAVDDCLAPGYTQEGPLEIVRWPGGEKATITKYRNAFPDCHLQIDEMFSTGDRVVVRFTYTGTHRGEFEGLAPTGLSVQGKGIDVLHMRDERIVASFLQWDALGLMQQLGAVTLPGKVRAAGA